MYFQRNSCCLGCLIALLFAFFGCKPTEDRDFALLDKAELVWQCDHQTLTFPNTLLFTSKNKAVIAGYEMVYPDTGNPHMNKWLTLLDENFETQWEIIGTEAGDDAYVDAAMLNDSTLVAVGYTSKFGRKKDMLITAYNLNGTERWTKTIAGNEDDEAFQVVVLPNNRMMIVGFSHSTDGIFANNVGIVDAFVAVLDADGNHFNHTFFGGAGRDYLVDAVYHPDGYVACVGFTHSFGVAIYANNRDRSNGWIHKYDMNGKLLNIEPIGDHHNEEVTAVTLLSNGNLLLVGNQYPILAPDSMRRPLFVDVDLKNLKSTSHKCKAEGGILFCVQEVQPGHILAGGRSKVDDEDKALLYHIQDVSGATQMVVDSIAVEDVGVVMHITPEHQGRSYMMGYKVNRNGEHPTSTVKVLKL